MSDFKSDEIKLIVGLGNPDEEYTFTRHNTGAIFLSYLREKLQFPDFIFDKYADAVVSVGNFKETRKILVFPHTYMNNSGTSVGYIMEKEHIIPEQILILHDDKDINFGDYRLQKSVSSAGHKGVQSIIDTVGTNIFWRLRIGIGPVPPPLTTDIFVLQKFSTQEIETLSNVFETAITNILAN